MKQLTLPELAALLKQQDNYIMLTHRRPDGDTVGSAAALCRGLRAMGKTAAVLKNPQFTEKFRPYFEGLTVDAVPENAVLVAVDVASENLLTLSAENYVNKIDLLIDHHGSNTGFAPEGLVDVSAAACGEIILALLRQLGAPVDSHTAEALYVAISTDTGCFRFSNVTANTLRAAAICKDCGADTFAINRTMFLTKRMPRLKLESYLTQTMEFYHDGRVAIGTIPAGVRRELGVTEDDIDDISEFGRDIAGVEIAAMLREEGERTKISVRTSPNYDASALCAQLGGGGHKAAAGATLDVDLNAAKQAVLSALENTVIWQTES